MLLLLVILTATQTLPDPLHSRVYKQAKLYYLNFFFKSTCGYDKNIYWKMLQQGLLLSPEKP